MDVLTHKVGEARSRLAHSITNTFGSKNREPENKEYSKPVSTTYLPKPTDPDTGTSTLPDIRTAKNRIKWPNPSNNLHGRENMKVHELLEKIEREISCLEKMQSGKEWPEITTEEIHADLNISSQVVMLYSCKSKIEEILDNDYKSDQLPNRYEHIEGEASQNERR